MDQNKYLQSVKNKTEILKKKWLDSFKSKDKADEPKAELEYLRSSHEYYLIMNKILIDEIKEIRETTNKLMFFDKID